MCGVSNPRLVIAVAACSGCVYVLCSRYTTYNVISARKSIGCSGINSPAGNALAGTSESVRSLHSWLWLAPPSPVSKIPGLGVECRDGLSCCYCSKTGWRPRQMSYKVSRQSSNDEVLLAFNFLEARAMRRRETRDDHRRAPAPRALSQTCSCSSTICCGKLSLI